MKSLLISITSFFVVCGLLSAYSPAAKADDVRDIIRNFAVRADSGDADALYQLALLHERGYDSIPRDSIRAMQLLAESAGRGSLKAQNLLGYNLLNKGDRSGLQWIEKAALAGDAKAQGNIGFLLLNSDIVERDPSKAAYWLERAAAGGVATASSMLGDLYRYGDGVMKDTLQAEAHYYAALDAGLADAAYKLADMMAEKWNNLPDSVMYGKALYLYTHRAPDIAIPIFSRLGEASVDNVIKGKSLSMLGDAYTRALGVDYSHDKSLEYYLKAALEGDP